MESEQVSIVFLHIGALSSDILEQKKVTVINKDAFLETANDASFNESKYAGTIALYVAQRIPIVISNSEDFITKKGGLSLSYHIATRANKAASKFILVTDHTQDLDPKSNEGKLFKLVPDHVTTQEFLKYDIVLSKIVDLSNIKVTCGLLTSHVQNGVKITGHMTRGFGITYDNALLIKENNAEFFQKLFKGEIVQLITNGKDGGSIVMVSDLGKTAHITNNTSIKSMLSGPVLEKYNDGIMEFNLQDIDKTAKTSVPITLVKGAITEVLITGFYIYAI